MAAPAAVVFMVALAERETHLLHLHHKATTAVLGLQQRQMKALAAVAAQVQLAPQELAQLVEMAVLELHLLFRVGL